jgi:hypothetical protein
MPGEKPMARAADLVDLALFAQLERVETLARRARGRLRELQRAGEPPAGTGALAELRAPLLDLAGELPHLETGLTRLLRALEASVGGPTAATPVPERRRGRSGMG